jgi:hypothetical protein
MVQSADDETMIDHLHVDLVTPFRFPARVPRTAHIDLLSPLPTDPHLRRATADAASAAPAVYHQTFKIATGLSSPAELSS